MATTLENFLNFELQNGLKTYFFSAFLGQNNMANCQPPKNPRAKVSLKVNVVKVAVHHVLGVSGTSRDSEIANIALKYWALMEASTSALGHSLVKKNLVFVYLGVSVAICF